MGKAKITNKQILHLIDEGKTMKEICNILQVNKSSIRKRLRKLNIVLPNRWNETKFNENIFDFIDTEDKAYWLGFIFADGYISSSNYTFEISLSTKDLSHLEKFNNFMEHINYNIKICKTNFENCTRCRWSITNKHLWKTLNSYGCTPRKSLTLEFPNEDIFTKKSLISHFIRGYVDGDGYIGLTRDKLVIQILGTELFLKEIIKYSAIDRNLYTKNLNTFTIAYSHSPAIQMGEYLYNNATIFLDRKYNRYRFAVLQSNL